MASTERPDIDEEDDATALADRGEDFIEGDAARDAYPTEVAAAIRYAEENKYDYGPKLRDADLQWDVNGVEPMGEGISRVFIDYTPSRFVPRLVGDRNTSTLMLLGACWRAAKSVFRSKISPSFLSPSLLSL